MRTKFCSEHINIMSILRDTQLPLSITTKLLGIIIFNLTYLQTFMKWSGLKLSIAAIHFSTKSSLELLY